LARQNHRRLISLASWTLVLCPSAAPVVANDGPAPPVVRAAGWEEHSKNLLDLLIPGAKGARPGVWRACVLVLHDGVWRWGAGRVRSSCRAQRAMNANARSPPPPPFAQNTQTRTRHATPHEHQTRTPSLA
jgi:hypothetical protein